MTSTDEGPCFEFRELSQWLSHSLFASLEKQLDPGNSRRFTVARASGVRRAVVSVVTRRRSLVPPVVSKWTRKSRQAASGPWVYVE
ncbi:unnamed protein product [Lampetra planeri]